LASGPDDELVRLLFEFWLDSALQERQIAVYSDFVLGETQGHFTLTDPPRLLASRGRCSDHGARKPGAEVDRVR
jgi:hypothetical protein